MFRIPLPPNPDGEEDFNLDNNEERVINERPRIPKGLKSLEETRNLFPGFGLDQATGRRRGLSRDLYISFGVRRIIHTHMENIAVERNFFQRMVVDFVAPAEMNLYRFQNVYFPRAAGGGMYFAFAIGDELQDYTHTLLQIYQKQFPTIDGKEERNGNLILDLRFILYPKVLKYEGVDYEVHNVDHPEFFKNHHDFIFYDEDGWLRFSRVYPLLTPEDCGLQTLPRPVAPEVAPKVEETKNSFPFSVEPVDWPEEDRDPNRLSELLPRTCYHKHTHHLHDMFPPEHQFYSRCPCRELDDLKPLMELAFQQWSIGTIHHVWEGAPPLNIPVMEDDRDRFFLKRGTVHQFSHVRPNIFLHPKTGKPIDFPPNIRTKQEFMNLYHPMKFSDNNDRLGDQMLKFKLKIVAQWSPDGKINSTLIFMEHEFVNKKLSEFAEDLKGGKRLKNAVFTGFEYCLELDGLLLHPDQTFLEVAHRYCMDGPREELMCLHARAVYIPERMVNNGLRIQNHNDGVFDIHYEGFLYYGLDGTIQAPPYYCRFTYFAEKALGVKASVLADHSYVFTHPIKSDTNNAHISKQ